MNFAIHIVANIIAYHYLRSIHLNGAILLNHIMYATVHTTNFLNKKGTSADFHA